MKCSFLARLLAGYSRLPSVPSGSWKAAVTLNPGMGKGDVVDLSKFEAMVREFPFLAKVFDGLNELNIVEIVVKCVDRNLLEVTPCCHSRDLVLPNAINYDRRFWRVSADGLRVQKLDGMLIHHRWGASDEVKKDALLIGVQLLVEDSDIGFIVEVNGNSDRSAFKVGAERSVVIYKMGNFDWRYHAVRIRRH